MLGKILYNKVFKFLFSVLEFLVFGILILYVLFIACQRLNNNNSVFNHKIFSVVTGSMVPYYSIDDVILVEDTSVDKLSVGDDVAYIGSQGSFAGKIVVHRIIKIEETSDGGYIVFTQGVKNLVADPSIDPNQIIGKVVRKIYSISFVNHIIKNKFGFFFLIFVPIFLIISVEIVQTLLEIKGIEFKNSQISSSLISDKAVSENKDDIVNLSDTEGDDDNG